MNIFERAARAKVRFSSAVGELTTEQLFDLPLTATGNRLSLDAVARDIYRGAQEVRRGQLRRDQALSPARGNNALLATKTI